MVTPHADPALLEEFSIGLGLLAASDWSLPPADRASGYITELKGKEIWMINKDEERSRKLQLEIAQRRQAEEALRVSEERYGFLVEKMNDCLGVMDEHGGKVSLESEPKGGTTVKIVLPIASGR